VNAERAGRFGSSTSNVLPSVQWLRAIAAMMVVIHHINFHTDWLREQAGGAPSLLSSVPWSFEIHIFFVISGFIMILTTKNFGGPGAWKRFLLRRTLRIVPLYWILATVMVVGVVLAPHSIEISGDRFWYTVNSYCFIPVLRTPGDLRPILGQGWTLDYEMYFYVALALATLCTRRVGIGILTAVFIVLSWFGRDLDVSTPKLFARTDGIILEFVLGLYLGFLYQSG
jgi:peptidoglycan/LPS O-acetylase OafA/YrhL